MATTDDSNEGFAGRLREAIDARGVTLAWLHEQLRAHGDPVSLATLSYWRSGQRQPEGPSSMAAVDRIEQLLGVATGYLAEAIGPSSRIGRASPLDTPFEDERHTREVKETMAQLETAPQGTLRELAAHVIAWVGERGTLERVTTRFLAQASGDSVVEIPFVGLAPEETDVVCDITDTIGVHVAKSYVHPGRLAVGHLLRFDVPVRAGETVMFEITKRYPEAYPATREVWHGTMNRSRGATVWVCFHPAALPAWCEEYEQTRHGTITQPRELMGASVHAVRYGFGPALLGLRWGDANSDGSQRGSQRER